jgi:hypothetical protein
MKLLLQNRFEVAEVVKSLAYDETIALARVMQETQLVNPHLTIIEIAHELQALADLILASQKVRPAKPKAVA